MNYEHVWNNRLSENQRDALMRCAVQGTLVAYSENAKRCNWNALTANQRERLRRTDWNISLGEVVIDPRPERSFEDLVNDKLGQAAAAKGYDGPAGQLLGLCKDLPHPLGEIVYKAVRYARKEDPDDLVKIAAWAKLIWQQRQVAPAPPESHSISRCT